MPSNRERKLQLREDAIIAAAARLIDKIGFTHLTMDMLAQEAGIAKATLYQHFDNKEAVVIASTLRGMINLKQFVAANQGSAIDQLESIMRFMMASTYDADGFPKMAMHDEALHLFRQHEEIAGHFQHVNTHLIELIEQAQRAGDIAPDLNPLVIISMMMTNTQVAEGSQIYGLKPQVFIDQTIRIFFRGLRPGQTAS